VTDGYGTVRSYQRIFSPERRIHQIEGRSLPVPGGVPLRWLAWALAALVAVLVLCSGSLIVPVVAAAAAGASGLAIGDRTAGLLAAAAAAAGTMILGAALGVLDWPLRLVVLPVGIATAATQATPDGRRPERFAVSWLALRLAPARRSLGRGLLPRGAQSSLGGRLWVAPDSTGPRLRRSQISGPGAVHFVSPMVIRRRRLIPGRLIAVTPSRFSRAGRLRRRVVLGPNETLEVRP
jgi:hypothetical protein